MGVNYDKKTFLAGVAVGRQLKGWGAANIGGGKGEEGLIIVLHEQNNYALTQDDKDKLIAFTAADDGTPLHIFLEYNNWLDELPVSYRIIDGSSSYGGATRTYKTLSVRNVGTSLRTYYNRYAEISLNISTGTIVYDDPQTPSEPYLAITESCSSVILSSDSTLTVVRSSAGSSGTGNTGMIFDVTFPGNLVYYRAGRIDGEWKIQQYNLNYTGSNVTSALQYTWTAPSSTGLRITYTR